MNPRHNPARRGTIFRMTIRTAIAAGALVLAGGAGVVAAEAGQPAAKCKTISVSTITETRAVTRDAPGHDETGTQGRTVTTTTERCRGKVGTRTTYGAWSAPTYTH